ncbi:DNA (cytosine-5-)-methyltransferase [Gordonia sp. ABSL11-1]|uniref:DNA cytosine methyltransferase n=1 Tax=Gordonia sp. ABSL11-1 TaxID=3053924 RepID=UPI0025722FC4|nr:DNA (cytosine-5-)-methyltransferase [Gordonia sp. ABSL11-1]MDL9944545.1 DNA (cytosine-5-)-methyltransferase [Gordonia sp. ABSL11-1]
MTTPHPAPPAERQTSLLDLLSTGSPAPKSRLGRHAVAAASPIRPKEPTSTEDPIRFVDDLAGIGGFHLALASLGAQCVFATENDPLARATYQNNFQTLRPELFSCGRFASDIGAVDPADIPEHDVVTASFPVQPFSFKEMQRGHDEHDTLLVHLARLIRHTQPRAYIFEDVAGLRFHHQGRTFAAIRNTMTSQLGYSFHTGVLRACDFGLPQLRPRLFMVGFKDPSTPFAFPDPVPLTQTLGDVLGGQCDRELSYTLLGSGLRDHANARVNWDTYTVDDRVHRLTSREAAALQGFPDGFKLPASRARALRQVGNSVAVPVASAVAREVISALRAAKPGSTANKEMPA